MIKRDLEFQKAFGKHLKELREKTGWTQMDLAAVSHINETQISKIETGDYGPNLQTLRCLAIALGIRPHELLNFDFDLKLNVNFDVSNRKRSGISTTAVITQLYEENYFDVARSVAEVLDYCKREMKLTLASADISGVLLRFVEKGRLKRAHSTLKGKSLYQANTE